MTSPSPWAVEASPRGALDSWYVQDAIGEDVCRVRGGEATTEANARLIAAAPELLDLLRRMATTLSTAASYIARDTDRGIADAFEAEANQARELIARVGL